VVDTESTKTFKNGRVFVADENADERAESNAAFPLFEFGRSAHL
jgi:hypothetical protein